MTQAGGGLKSPGGGSSGGKQAGGAGAAGGSAASRVAASPTAPGPEFMTQATQQKGRKRSIPSPAVASPSAVGMSRAQEPDEQPVKKRLRMEDEESAAAAGTAVEDGPTVTHFDAPIEAEDPCTSAHPEDDAAAVPGEARAAPSDDGRGSKSMLQTVFSPIFRVFGTHGEGAGGGGGGSGSSGEDDAGEAGRGGTATRAGAAAPHAHHPPAPEVPEAAESEYDDDEEDEGCVDFDPLLFIKTLPPLEQCIPQHRPMLLPRKTRQCKKKTLVLDLDETLVHSTLEGASSSDFSFKVHFNNQEHVIHVKQRPHLHEFMKSVAELFEVVVFTASQRVYAEKLLNVIDPNRNLIKHRIYRESCVIVDGNYLKDLTVLGRDLSSTFIVDNSPQAFGFQPNNGIPIESWYDDEQDTELLKLLPFLTSLNDVDDVRPHIANKFRLMELIQKIQLG
mmetsp:Transcript_3598/g.10058  ORF Transcript_3598/g.10058 Transcript_3598/m.10058 type:complete len:448 (-) Transcript_3598:125-1468(-)